jgi:hypothetical protein
VSEVHAILASAPVLRRGDKVSITEIKEAIMQLGAAVAKNV